MRVAKPTPSSVVERQNWPSVTHANTRSLSKDTRSPNHSDSERLAECRRDHRRLARSPSNAQVKGGSKRVTQLGYATVTPRRSRPRVDLSDTARLCYCDAPSRNRELPPDSTPVRVTQLGCATVTPHTVAASQSPTAAKETAALQLLIRPPPVRAVEHRACTLECAVPEPTLSSVVERQHWHRPTLPSETRPARHANQQRTLVRSALATILPPALARGNAQKAPLSH